MICLHDEVAPPQVQALVRYGLDKADELMFVRCDLEMTSNEGLTEESEGSSVLVDDGAEPRTERVALHNEVMDELLIVAGKPQEAAQAAGRAWRRP